MSVQTFEQLLEYLLKNKEVDYKATEIIEESGYLFMWQHEVNANPWRYDAKLFMDLPVPRGKLHEIAQFEINSAQAMKTRFEFMYQQFMVIWQQHKIHYAAMNITLYQKLIELSDVRISVAQYVQENTDPLPKNRNPR